MKRSGLFVVVLMSMCVACLPASAGDDEQITVKDQIILDLVNVAQRAVYGCCNGESTACTRYENASSGLLEWCAKGEKAVCKFREALQVQLAVCQTQ
jgi:hypothetical protein